MHHNKATPGGMVDVDAIRTYVEQHLKPATLPMGIKKIEPPPFKQVRPADGMFIVEKPSTRQAAFLARLEQELGEKCVFSRSFYAKLCKYIDRREYKNDAEFYRAVGISRQSFSRIRNAKNAGVLPSKRSIIVMAVELRLSEEEAIQLLNLAGYTFQDNKQSDVIMRFFFKEKCFDRFVIDHTLTYFGESPLFSDL